MIDGIISKNYYDSCAITDEGFATHYAHRGDSWLKLFGNANIGMRDWCNLNIPGQFGGDCTFVVQRWYARTDVPITPGFVRWASHVSVTFIEGGDRPRWQLPLTELLARRPRVLDDGEIAPSSAEPWPLLLPPRQHFSCSLDLYGGDDIQIFERSKAARLWIHLEGLEIESRGTTPRQLAALLLKPAVKERNVEEQIAQWLQGQVQLAQGIDKGTIAVIRDAILEGRYRG